jgi:RNA methyltransferase, TrmH family
LLAPGISFADEHGTMILTSPANERVKHAKRVRDGLEPGAELIFLEGERLIEEAQRSGLALTLCFHHPEPSERMASCLTNMTCERLAADARVLGVLGDTRTTQGIIALAERPRYGWENVWARAGTAAPLLVALERLQDPGNLGTLIRTAEAAGAHGLVALPGCADAFSPKALRAAMGSTFRLPVMTSETTDSLLSLAQSRSIRPLAAAGSGSQSHHAYDWSQPTLLVLGNEGSGISEALLARCPTHVRIAMRAPVESLNVAAAGAVLLFEAARQREAS